MGGPTCTWVLGQAVDTFLVIFLPFLFEILGLKRKHQVELKPEESTKSKPWEIRRQGLLLIKRYQNFCGCIFEMSASKNDSIERYLRRLKRQKRRLGIDSLIKN